MASSVTIHDKSFTLYLHRDEIRKKVCELATQMEEDYKGKKPLFIGVLNGAFIFAADLFHAIDIEAEISFIKVSSYTGTRSSGTVLNILGLSENIENRHVIIVEDIIDTGKTLSELLPQIQDKNPASVKVATIFSKPDARTHNVTINYTGFEIPDKFIVGYGLDYDGLGRNLTHVYSLAEDQ